MKLICFSDSHLAPKFFKVVANSKKFGHHFQRQTKLVFYAVIVLEIVENPLVLLVTQDLLLIYSLRLPQVCSDLQEFLVQL